MWILLPRTPEHSPTELPRHGVLRTLNSQPHSHISHPAAGMQRFLCCCCFKVNLTVPDSQTPNLKSKSTRIQRVEFNDLFWLNSECPSLLDTTKTQRVSRTSIGSLKKPKLAAKTNEELLRQYVPQYQYGTTLRHYNTLFHFASQKPQQQQTPATNEQQQQQITTTASQKNELSNAAAKKKSSTATRGQSC